jgi:hypothetical protein
MAITINDRFVNCKPFVCVIYEILNVNFMFMRKKINEEIKKGAFSRMESVLREKNIKPADFQKTLNIDSQNWNNWKNRGLPSNEFIRIAAIIGVKTDWLAVGKGEKYAAYEKQSISKTEVSECRNGYLNTENEATLLSAFRRLTIEQQQSVITNAQEIARKNEQIIKELKEKI